MIINPSTSYVIQIINHQSKRFYNKRIAASVSLKYQRKLDQITKKVNEVQKVQFEPEPIKIKKNVSNLIETVEGKEVVKRKLQILNKNYLESISEIISLHKNFEKIPRLNINNVETNNKLLHIDIYWNFTGEDPSKIEEYTRLLNEMKPDIRTGLSNTYYVNSPPEITFIYDVYDGINNQMEYLFGSVKEETSKLSKEPFDPAELFKKEKLIKKEFDIKSIVVRDPSVDFSRDEQNPIKFNHPYEMNLYMCNLEYKKIYESILVKLSQGKTKRTLGKDKQFKNQTTTPSLYVSPGTFKESDLDNEYVLPLTHDRVKLMKTFLVSNKKKIQRESRELKREMFDRLDNELDEKLSIKQKLDEHYEDHDNN